MSVTYYDRAGWQYILSQACSPVGDGQCDGFDPDDDEPCDCSCHTAPINSRITTVKQVKRMHELGWLHEGLPGMTLPQVVWRQPEERSTP